MRRVDWVKLAEQLERAAKDPKVKPKNRERAALSAHRLRAFLPVHEKLKHREG